MNRKCIEEKTNNPAKIYLKPLIPVCEIAQGGRLKVHRAAGFGDSVDAFSGACL